VHFQNRRSAHDNQGATESTDKSALSDATPRSDDDLTSILAKVIVYIDTVMLYVPLLRQGVVKRLRRVSGWAFAFRIPRNRFGRVIVVQQPGRVALRYLDLLQRRLKGTMCRVDIAYDLPVTKQWLERHVLLRYRRKGAMHDVEGTIYATRQRSRARKSNRDYSLYDDLASKITGLPKQTHFELRFQSGRAIRNEQWKKPSDLARINPTALFERHVILIDGYQPKAFKRQIIENTLKADRARMRDIVSSPSNRRYFANRTKRIERVLERAAYRRVQTAKDIHPRYVATLKRITHDDLNLTGIIAFRDIDKQGDFV
jgi:hypothetical protein